MILMRRHSIVILLFIGFVIAGFWRITHVPNETIDITTKLNGKVIKVLTDDEHSCIFCITDSRAYILDSSTLQVRACEAIDCPLDGYVVSNSAYRYVIVQRNGNICRLTTEFKSSSISQIGFGDLVGSACSNDGTKLAVIPTRHPSVLQVVDLVNDSAPIITIDSDICTCLFGLDTTALLTSSFAKGLVRHDLKSGNEVSIEVQIPNANVTIACIQNGGWLIVSDRHLYQIDSSSVRHLFLGSDQLILSESSGREIILFVDKGDVALIQRATTLSLEDICTVPNLAPCSFCISRKFRKAFLGYSDGTINAIPF